MLQGTADLIYVGIRTFSKPVPGVVSRAGVIAIKPCERWCRVGGTMRSMKMAALAVAMTLMFSGLALARDHDQYKDKHDRWENHGDRDRHHDRDRDHNNWGNWGHNRDRDHDRWERDHRRNDGYYGGGQIYNRY